MGEFGTGMAGRGLDIWNQKGPGGRKQGGIQLLFLINMVHKLVFECRGTKAKQGKEKGTEQTTIKGSNIRKYLSLKTPKNDPLFYSGFLLFIYRKFQTKTFQESTEKVQWNENKNKPGIS